MLRTLRLLPPLIALLLGATVLTPTTANAVQPYFGEAQITAPYPGFLRLTGWAKNQQFDAERVRVWVLIQGESYPREIGVAAGPSQNSFLDGHTFDLYVHVRDREGPTSVRVYFSNSHPEASQPDAQGYVDLPRLLPFGAVESIVSNAAGQVTISGWAIDPAEPTAKVRVSATQTGAEGSASQPRADVGNAYPPYGPDHGFTLTGPSSPGTKPICVEALGSRGIANLGCATVKVNPPGVIEAGVDVVVGGEGRVRVAGWAFDYDAPNTAVGIHLYVGGAPGTPGAAGFDLGPANGTRTDVGTTYGVGSNHGFDKIASVGRFGDQPIYLYAINVGGTPGNNTLIAQRTIHISRDLNPPDTEITSGPVGTVHSPTVTYGFSATEPGSTFECAWDGEPWAACTSPATRDLDNGPHSFSVRAVDGSGNKDQTPASRGIIVDAGGSNSGPKVNVAVKAVKKKTKLRVNIGPDSAMFNYKFKVQRRVNGKWKTVKRSRTKGERDLRTLDLKRGVYRVKVPAQHGLRSAKSRKVRLRR